MNTQPRPRLVWIDLEMTGLDPRAHVILELALIVTDGELRPLAKPLNVAVWQPACALEIMSPYVRAMHEKTGLLARVAASRHAVEDVERQALGLVAQHAPYRTARLAGNSVGYDRLFLRAYMPHLEHHLHYRQLDVSSIKEAVTLWGGAPFDKPDAGKHTALADIERSIAELAHFRRSAFLPGLGGAAPAAPAG